MDMDVVESLREADEEAESSGEQPSRRLRTSNKGFKCPVKACTFEFPTKKALNAHKISSHAFFHCTFPGCPRVFKSDRRRSLHLVRCHPHATTSPQSPPSLPPPTRASNSLITDLQTATLVYLQRIKLLALPSEGEKRTKMASVVGIDPLPEVGLAFLMHAVDVAMGLPEAPKVESVPSKPPPQQPAEESEESSDEPKKKTHGHKRRKRARHESDPPFTVSLPGMRISDDGSKRRGPKPSVHVCTKCTKVFPYKKELKAHKNAEHPGKRPPAVFEVQMLQLVPPEVPTEAGSYACIDPECGRTFETEARLLAHVRDQHI